MNIISTLDVEYPSRSIEFIINDLTIKVKNSNGRDDYLWEIGSASNWLSYHISILLAFQKFFQNKNTINIPNILILDQPSQVYFPQKLSSKTVMYNDPTYENDEDKAAVKKIFNTLSKYVIQDKTDVQIIVMEHADDDIWGDIEGIHLVERWRGNNKKLIPQEWIN